MQAACDRVPSRPPCLLLLVPLAACGAGTPPGTVLPCDSLGPAGASKEITPPQVSLDRAFETPAGQDYGAHSFMIDPRNTANVYLGTSAQGIYRADCGATWKKVNTGLNGDVIDGGRRWTFLIDPGDPDVMYTNTGTERVVPTKRRTAPSTRNRSSIRPRQGPAVWRVRPVHAHRPHRSPAPARDPTFQCEIDKDRAVSPRPRATSSRPRMQERHGGSWKVAPRRRGSQPVDDRRRHVALVGALRRDMAHGEQWRHMGSCDQPGHILDGEQRSRAGRQVLFRGRVHHPAERRRRVLVSLPDSPGTDFLATDGAGLFAARGAYYGVAEVGSPSTWTQLRPRLQQTGQRPHLGPAVRPRPSHPVLPRLHERLLAPRSQLGSRVDRQRRRRW